MAGRLVAAVALAAALAVPATAGAARFTVPLSVPADGSTNESASAFAGAAADGSVVVFGTSEGLVAEDTDGQYDAYARRGSRVELVSVPEGDASGGLANPLAVSADGSAIVFQSEDTFHPDDSDGDSDIYVRRAGHTELVTRRSGFIAQGTHPLMLRVSEDGAHIVFETNEQLAANDDFFGADVYDYHDGAPQLVSGTGAASSDDVHLAAVSSDGSRIFMTTTDNLVPAADQDGELDTYMHAGGQITLMSPGTVDQAPLAGISGDGSHAYFRSRESLVAGDDDQGSQDVYGNTATGPYSLISTGPLDNDEPIDADFQKADATGAHVAFTTFQTLTNTDVDNGVGEDIYVRVDETSTELASTAAQENPNFYAGSLVFSDLSRDGTHVYFYTHQVLADDTEPFSDAFDRHNGVTTRLSVGEINDDAAEEAAFAGASADGTRTFFQTIAQFTTDDTDMHPDFYERAAGRTTLVTPTPAQECELLPSSRCEPIWKGNSSDGRRVWFHSDERHDASDTDDATDVYESRLAVPGTLSSSLPALAAAEGGPPAPIFTDLTVADPYDDVFGASVTIAGGEPGDTLGFTDTGSIRGHLSPDGRTLTLEGRASDMDYQAALRSVTFQHTGEAPTTAPRTAEVVIDNGAPSAAATRTITVALANDAPTVSAGGTVFYAENGAPRPIASGLTVSDPDHDDFAGATVKIAAGHVAGEDVLSGPGSFDPSTGTLTLAGADASQAALREVRYHNTSDAPSAATRTLEIVVDDGEATSPPVSVPVEVLPVNDAPVVTLAAAPAQASAGGPVAVDPAATIRDPDGPAIVAVRADITVGRLDGDSLSTPEPSEAGLRALTFTPAGAGTRVVEVTASDGHATSAPARRTIVAGVAAPTAPVAGTPPPSWTGAPAVVLSRVARTLLGRATRYAVVGNAFTVNCAVRGHAVRRCSVRLVRHGRTLGFGRQLAPAGGGRLVRVTVRLNRASRRLLARSRRPLAATLTGTTITVDGTPTVETSRWISLRERSR